MKPKMGTWSQPEWRLKGKLYLKSDTVGLFVPLEKCYPGLIHVDKFYCTKILKKISSTTSANESGQNI